MSDGASVERTRKTGGRAKLLNPAEVADWLGVSSGWVRDHATRKKPRLPVVRLGKLLRFRTEEIEDFLTHQGITG